MSKLAERLRGIAATLRRVRDASTGETNEDAQNAADEIDALADYADGRVVVEPEETTPGRFYLWERPFYIYITPDTWGAEADRMARLQAKIDEHDGRVMPE